MWTPKIVCIGLTRILHTVATVPLIDAKVTLWCNSADTVFFSPYFFENTTPTSLVKFSVKDARYTAMLQKYIIPELFQRNAPHDVIWMEDDALSQIAKSVYRAFEQLCDDRITSHYLLFSWSLRFPDLTPIDFWFWGHSKSRVYMCNLQTLSDLKDSIKYEIANIPYAMLCSSVLSTVSRMQCVIACNDLPVENISFK